MGDDLEDAIRTNAEGPASASDETGGVTRHTLAGMSTAERLLRRVFIPSPRHTACYRFRRADPCHAWSGQVVAEARGRGIITRRGG